MKIISSKKVSCFKALSFFLFGILFNFKLSSQILTFDFAGLAGSEVSAVSNFNNAGITNSTITRGVGLVAALNADRFNATNWALTSIPNAVAGNNYMEFTITPNAGNQFSISSIVVSIQRSGTGPSGIALRSSADGYVTDLGGIFPIVDNTLTQTFTFTFAQSNACNVAITYRVYMFAEATGGSGGIGDFAGNDITVNGSVIACPVNTITTGAIVGSPFTVTCSAFVSFNVPFTSTGTFNVGNIFTAQLSDASGSFSFPLTIGTLSLSGVAPSGNIPSTILAGVTSGAAYRIRVVSSNPVTTGTDNGVNLAVNNGGSPCYGPLIMNEVSQGPSGSKEYVEVLVVGNNPCGTIDIRNLIVDDNNGDFSGGPVGSSGIANGHIRFTNSGQWSNVPSGSLIIIYNNGDINAAVPADDPSDLIIPDKVYILPANSSFLEGCSTIPTVGNASYTPCAYGAGSFSYMSFANTADAAQTRYADGTYNHGVSWGTIPPPMTGGPDGLNIGTTSSSGQLVEFENTVDDDYTNILNFTRSNAPADETPGAPNSANNATFIASLTCLTLPVDFLNFDVINSDNKALVHWETATELNCSHFIIERAGIDAEFMPLGKLYGNGTTNFIHAYSFMDQNPLNGQSYYRLRQVDFDGQFEFSKIKPFHLENSSISNSHFDGQQLYLSGCEEGTLIQVFNATGSIVLSKITNENLILDELTSGYYVVRIVCGIQHFNLPISVIR